MTHCIDLRFAGDVLSFAQSSMDDGKLLGSLVAELPEVGPVLNANKTVVFMLFSQVKVNCVQQSRNHIEGLHVTCVRIGTNVLRFENRLEQELHGFWPQSLNFFFTSLFSRRWFGLLFKWAVSSRHVPFISIYIPAAPDVQGNKANFKPLLRRCGPGRGWRLVGGGCPRPAHCW